MVDLAGLVGGSAVGQVPAVCKAHAEDGIPRLEQRRIDRKIRLRSAVGLDVHELRAEQLLRAGNGKPLDLIDDLAAAVIALGGQTLGIFIREDRAHAGDDRSGGNVL